MNDQHHTDDQHAPPCHKFPSVASTELFDCPYCKGRPVYITCMGEHWVRCNTDMCQYETDFRKSEAEAKDAWNKQVLASRLILDKSNNAVRVK